LPTQVGPVELQEIGELLVDRLDLDILLHRLAMRLREMFGADLGLVLVTDERSHRLGVRYDLDHDAAALRARHRGAAPDPGRPAGGRCQDLIARLCLAEHLDDAELELVRALANPVYAPLLAQRRPLGVILLGAADRRWSLSGEDVAWLTALAIQISLAVDNALLRSQQGEALHRLYQTERLAAAGQLAAGVAHEVRNPLTVISSTIQYLAQGLPQGDVKQVLAAELLSEVARIKQVIDGLTGLAQQRELQRSPLNLLDVLDQALLLITAQLNRQDVVVEKRYGRDRFDVLGDRNQLKQVFLNLLLNALQAMGGRGRISVRARLVETGAHTAAERRVEVEVADTGRGIEPAHLARVFEPFFTTKREGTGLGLVVCESILTLHGGEIALTSLEGQGTTVHVRLPLLG
jgi:signal transduction histidine kinase